MSNIIQPKSLWRFDVGRKDDEAPTRALARRMDAAGNKDGKVSLAEVDAWDKKLDAVMGDHRFSAWTDPSNDPVKRAAWVEHNKVHDVRETLTNGHGLAADLAVKHLGGVLEGAAALLWFGPSIWLNGKKVG
jgi:hypothetical protein